MSDAVVVDASVVVKLFVEEDGSTQAASILGREGLVWVPAHALAEISEVLVRKCRTGQITSEQLGEAVMALPGMFASIDLDVLIADAVELARAMNHSVYDCLYLSAARRHDVALVTADREFADKARQVGHEQLVLLSDFAAP